MPLFRELKRRNVIRTATLYVVASWLILQVADILFDAFELPAWSMRLLIVVLLIGLVLTVFLSWIFELTPGGLRRDDDHGGTRSRPSPGKPVNAAIAVLLILGAGLLVVDRLVLNPAGPAERAPRVAGQVPERSVAVLPFANISDEPDSDYFSAGLAEEILNTLAGIPGLLVSSRTSSFTFEGQGGDARGIGDRLGVAHVLEGSVRKAGDNLRISVQLIDARTGFESWSATFDRTMGDVFAVQREIATETAAALSDSLIGVPASVRETDPEAFAAYLRALYFFRQSSPDSLDKAVRQLRGALEIDPEYAPAWNLLGSIYASQALTGELPFDEGHEMAMVATQRALDLDPDYAFANSARGWLAMTYEGDYPAAADHFRRALRLAPGNGVIIGNAAVLARSLGQVERAIAMTEDSIRRDPVRGSGYINLADQLSRAGRNTDAVTAAQTALELTPDSITARINLALAYVLAEQPERALEAVADLDHPFFRLYVHALVYRNLGETTRATAALQMMIDDYGDSRAFYVAQVYAWRNDVDAAFDWLARAVDEEQPTLGIRTEPMLQTLHADPRWQPLLARVGLSDEQVAAIDF
jgi:TolB-like protein